MMSERQPRIKCYCGTKLRDDGTCVFRCPPQLAAPARRTREIRGTRADNRVGITPEQARAGLIKVDPSYAVGYARRSARSKKIWEARR